MVCRHPHHPGRMSCDEPADNVINRCYCEGVRYDYALMLGDVLLPNPWWVPRWWA